MSPPLLPREIRGSGDLWIAEAVLRYDGRLNRRMIAAVTRNPVDTAT